MNPTWKDFLQQQGAEFITETCADGTSHPRLVSFGNPHRERRIPPQGNIICDLSHIGLIRVQGDDAESFLQNQLTNDIHQVSENRSQLSGYCNHKGRLLANFRVMKRQGDFYLRLSHDLVEPIIKKLRMYVLMSKVTIEDVSNQLVHFGFSGPEADKILAKRTEKSFGSNNAPDNINAIIQHDSLSIIRLPGVVPRYEIFGELDNAIQLWQALDVDGAAVSHQSWQYLNILAGLPIITAASHEAWVPQMLNFDLIDAVSFNKGCFPGQEVVARLNYLGKTQRRCYRLQAQTDQLPNIGDSIIAITEKGEEEAGKVLNAVINPEDHVEILAVMKIQLVEKNLQLNNANATVCPLPYSLETAAP